MTSRGRRKLTQAELRALDASPGLMEIEELSEKQFQAQVVELARLSGWLCYHTFDSRRSASGFPDLVLVKPPRLIFAELKNLGGKLRPEQHTWLNALQGCESVEVRLWRPSQWEEIERMLKCRAKRGEER